MSDWTARMAEAAASKGLVVVRPAENELFVDIDDAAGMATFKTSIAILEGLVASHVVAPSPSGREDRFHVTVKLTRPVRDRFERIALQAILGSDRKHEALSWRAAVNGAADVTVFFEKPPAQGSEVAF